MLHPTCCTYMLYANYISVKLKLILIKKRYSTSSVIKEIKPKDSFPQLHIHMQKNEIGLPPHTTHKNKLKRDHQLKCNSQNYETLGRKYWSKSSRL